MRRHLGATHRAMMAPSVEDSAAVDPWQVVARLVALLELCLAATSAAPLVKAPTHWSWPEAPVGADECAREAAASRLLAGMGVAERAREGFPSYPPSFELLAVCVRAQFPGRNPIDRTP